MGFGLDRVFDEFGRWAAETLGAPALMSVDGAFLTAGELNREVTALSSRLHALGIGPADRLAMRMEPGPRHALLLLGTMAAGVAAPLHDTFTADELEAILPRLGLRAVIVTGPDDPLDAVARRLGIPVFRIVPLPGPFRAELSGDPVGPPVEAASHRDPEQLAILICTSGTTGSMKVVMRSGRAVQVSDVRDIPGLTVGWGDRSMVVTSLAHSLGFTTLTRGLSHRGSVAIAPTFDLDDLPQWLMRVDPTWLYVPPGVLRRIAGSASASPVAWNPSLRFIRTGSMALSDDLRARIPVPVYNAYSSTEAGRIAGEGPSAPHRPGFAGRVMCDVRIVDDGVVMPDGEPGEIQVRSDALFSGYLGDPESTAAAWTGDGWFRPGDRGYLQDGWLALLGRMDDVINRAGRKIDPEELDQHLRAYPGIADAAAFGVPDSVDGQRVAAAVVLAEGARLDRRALRRWLLERVSPWKVPSEIRVVSDIPRTPTGKPRRSALASAQHAG